MTTPGPRAAFCLACGWSGRRRLERLGVPCAACGESRIVVAGMKMPLPRDPKVIAAGLISDPELHWRVRRELEGVNLVGPWAAFQNGYWERQTLIGARVAWVRQEGIGGYHWETAERQGDEDDLEMAQAQADKALVEWQAGSQLVASKQAV